MTDSALRPVAAKAAANDHAHAQADDACGCGHDHDHGHHHHGHHHHTPVQTLRRAGPKIGRNDPCICNSGKKFKKCCGAAAA
jgi:preprotein translocase subunit SecA